MRIRELFENRPSYVVDAKDKPKKVKPTTGHQSKHPYQGRLVGTTESSSQKAHCDDKKLKEESDYSQYENEIEDFVQSLNPDDVGVEQIGPYHVHFEGFTDECQQDAERRCTLPSDNPRHLANYDDVFKEVIRDFVRREGGKKPLKVGFAGYEDYPVIYAVFENPAPYKNPDAWNPKMDENLRQWFKDKWVRFGPDGKIKGDCARGDDSEGKPKCLPQSKAHSLGKDGRASAARRKRREDPNPERRGAAKNVATKKESVVEFTNIPFNVCPSCRGDIVHESQLNEKQDACYHKVKSRYKVWPSAYASGALVQCRKKGAKNWGNSKK
jgi:hypothetical protein